MSTNHPITKTGSLTTYPTDFLACRTIAHPWGIHVEPHTGGRAWIVLTCPTCGLKRTDLIVANSGTLLRREYIYPDGYKRGRTVKQKYRKEFVARATGYGRAG